MVPQHTFNQNYFIEPFVSCVWSVGLRCWCVMVVSVWTKESWSVCVCMCVYVYVCVCVCVDLEPVGIGLEACDALH